MRSDSLFAAFGAAPSLALSLLSVLYVVVSAYVYISLIHQISARAAPQRSGVDAATRSFGLPEAILAAVLIIFLLLNIGASVSRHWSDPAILCLSIDTMGRRHYAAAFRRRFEQAKHRRVFQRFAHDRAANHDHRFRNSNRTRN